MDTAFAILFVIAVGLGVAYSIAFANRRPPEESRVWGRVADELGLVFAPGGLLSVSTVFGPMDGFSVRAERYTTAREENGTQVVVRGGGIDPGLHIRRRSDWSKVSYAYGTREFRIGDPAFDQELRVNGPPLNTVAVLNQRNRALLLRSFTGGIEVVDGEVRFKVPDRPGDVRGIADLIRFTVSVAQACRLQESVPDALARNVEADPEAGVRRSSLELLIQHHPEASATTAATRKAMDDPDPEIRLLAATSDKGMYGHAALERLIESDVDEGVRARALAELARSYGTAVSPTVRKALHAQAPAVRRSAIDAVALLHDLEALPNLCALLPSDPCAADCARALWVLGDARGEAALLQFLAQGETPVQTAAAKALGACGTIKAVEPLLEHARGLLLPGDLKEAARDAVRAIQSRLGDVEAGRLALAEPMAEQGALSISGGEGEKSR
jgi:HEAT repeat protein